MSMTKEQFEDYVENSAKEFYHSVQNKSKQFSQEEKIEYLKNLGYKVEDSKNNEFNIIFVYKPDNDGMRPNLDMAFNYEKSQEIQNEKEKLKNLLCNKCGGDMNQYFDEDKKEGEPYGMVNVKVSGGYLSDPLNDLTSYKFNLCEHCIYEMFLSFKNPPEISLYLI